MIDREKVIEYLAWAIAEAELTGHTSISLEPLRDALELLKAQEPIIPCIRGEEGFSYNDFTRQYGCGSCGKPIDHGDEFCRHCGKAVKWE